MTSPFIPLDDDQWQTLILAAVDQDAVVSANLDDLWQRFAPMLTVDPSGELRYYEVLLAGIDLAIASATKDVATSDGGGTSGQWNQHFDHLQTVYQNNLAKRDAVLKRLSMTIDSFSTVMTTVSLTPALPGQNPYLSPGHPGYMGDPRYRRAGF